VLATLYALAASGLHRLPLRVDLGLAAVVASSTIADHAGLFSLFNKEISLNVVAALLTLVGYSMNDTIVVFDRIRETVNRAAAVLRGDRQ